MTRQVTAATSAAAAAAFASAAIFKIIHDLWVTLFHFLPVYQNYFF